MRRPFTKMHGLGNDFVVFDARIEPLALTGAQARQIADRHTGIGCDQVIVVEPSGRADAFMRIWNADGSAAEACGNAARCVATLIGDTDRGASTIDSAGGLLDASATAKAASIVYPPPRFEWDAVPLAYAVDTMDVPAAWDDLAHGVALSVGNPHIVFFVNDAAAAVPLDVLGPRIETDPLFPARVNVGIAQVVGRDHVVLRVWERGAGLTCACGTGAMAAAVAARRRRLVDARVTVSLPGGALTVTWDGGPITLSGPAATSFTGEVDL